MMQQGFQDEVDHIARRLSLETHCTIMHAEGRSLLICKHGVLFSMTRLQDPNDWDWVKPKHDKEVKI